MRIAIFHNFLDNIGGAEIVTLTLAKELNADVYTTNIDADKIKLMGFEGLRIYSIGRVPINAPLRQQSTAYLFRMLDLRGQYDFFIIAGDWAVSAAINNKPNMWYVHSPIREIWDLYGHTRQHTVPSVLRWVFDGWVMLNRRLNKSYVNHVNHLVCNSLNTRNRVKKYLNRWAVVIHPPVDTLKYDYRTNGVFWLSVNRLIGHKRIEMQIEAFRQMPQQKLVMVGSYEQSRHFKQYANHIQKMKPENVTILSWVDQSTLIDLYANCRGFITTAREEDFGMTAIEAMASGKFVIAPNEGGYKETVINNVTGRLIDGMSAEQLIAAVNDIADNALHYRLPCLNHARQFDTRLFIKKIKDAIGYANIR